MRTGPSEAASNGNEMESRKILVVGREDRFSEEIMNYAVQLAERLNCHIVAMNVGDGSNGKSSVLHRLYWREAFRGRAVKAASELKARAARRGIACDHVVKFGDLGSAVEDLNHAIKRIEFMVSEAEANLEEVTREVTIPVFSVASQSLKPKGGKTMANEQNAPKKKLLMSTIGFGLLTAGLYTAVFMNADTVMHFFTKGGWYATLPIATVFAFSYAHGNFAGRVWSLLGIEAVKRDALRQTEQKVIEKRKQARKRPRVYAYVNPWHRI
jgi:hypothetical protein